VVGNHDNFESDGKAGWKAFSGMAQTNYSFNHLGYHFVVIDCTLDPYQYPYVDCDSTLRAWVAADLAANPGSPTVVFSHFNMWRRPWNPMFDTTLVYAEYRGMPELRSVLENAGNVVAVVNGHVHANRVEVHNCIYYIDVAATLVGPPSIRYFHVHPDRIEVTYEYLRNRELAEYVASICPMCCCCFNPFEVCDFVDGTHSDKQFTIPIVRPAGAPAVPAAVPGSCDVALACDGRRVSAAISADAVGTVLIMLTDVLGRSIDRVGLPKTTTGLEVDLGREMPGIAELPPGIYFVRFSLGGAAATRKLVLVQ